MAQPVFFKYFTQDDATRLYAGFSTIDGKTKTAPERLRDILTTKRVFGGNQKSYFRYKMQMPLTISFTGAHLENLDQFFELRSKFGFAVLASRVPGAKPVLYLSQEELSWGNYNPQDRWRIDLVRTPGDFRYEEEGEEYDGYAEEMLPPKPYDFRWEQEWRLRVPREGASFERLDFVLVPRPENCKKANEVYGQEAYDVDDHIKRVNSYCLGHQGRYPPLEEMMGKHFLARHEKVKEARPQEGKTAMPEIVEAAWDEIRAGPPI